MKGRRTVKEAAAAHLAQQRRSDALKRMRETGRPVSIWVAGEKLRVRSVQPDEDAGGCYVLLSVGRHELRAVFCDDKDTGARYRVGDGRRRFGQKDILGIVISINHHLVDRIHPRP